MKIYWSLSSIAHKLTSHSRSRVVTEDSVMRWIRQGKLQAERITGSVRGHGKYPYQVEEQQLKSDLHRLGFDAEELFTKSPE